VKIAARALAAAACVLFAGAARADAEDQAAISALRARHAALQNDLAHNAFGRPLHLESGQNKGDANGDIHAVLEHPFARLNAALDAAENWCDILILHLNVKQCRSAGGPAWNTLTVYIGTKGWQSLGSAHRVVFDFNVRAHTAEYLRIKLDADQGPLGVHNFRIELEAMPLEPGRSFIHLSYSYTSGLAARLAMNAYLETLGSGKVGFSVIDRSADGKPVYVGGERGVIERNTMRYYLAIDTYVDTFDAAPGEQLDGRRLRRWFAATESYRRQLHELEEAEYLDMKRKELERQRGQ
jgi:hypothetical protein